MNVINKVEKWGDMHHPAVLDVLRFALGIFLLLKGFAFMQNLSYLQRIIQDQQLINVSPFLLACISYYVIFVHMAGGMLIAMGLLTRLCCLLQLPVVISAMYLISIFRSQPNSNEALSVIACVLLLLFLLIGSGPLSLNNILSPPAHYRNNTNN